MTRFLLGRALAALFALFAATILVFGMSRLTRGPARAVPDGRDHSGELGRLGGKVRS